jgi:hypothetical protein
MVSSTALIYKVVLWVLAPSSLVTTSVSDENTAPIVDEPYAEPSRVDHKVKPIVRNGKKFDKPVSAKVLMKSSLF